MPGWIDLANFAIVVAGLTIAILGFLLTIRIQYMDTWTKHFFMILFSILILYALSDMTSQISLVFLGKGFRSLSQAAVFLESLFSSILMPLLTVYLLHICAEPLRGRLFCTVLLFWLVYASLLVITQFTTEIYYFTADNIYQRGPLYPLLLCPPILLMLVNLAGLWHRRQQISGRDRLSLLIYLLLPTVCILIQMVSYGILFIVLGSVVSAMILFIFILNENAKRFIDQRIALSEQTFRAKTLQMRPHFIYNTMSSIYYLCELDPKKAQTVVDDFTTYLKKNFSAVVKEDLIPFSEELEHTRAYLNVIRARYEELLSVEYDTEYHSFRLPPLTLEPVVENAVKHALDPDAGPLHILVRTEAADNGSRITVENTGKSFSSDLRQISAEDGIPSPDGDDPHIGLANVASRLKTLCDGTLTIAPRTGGGTVVTIWIPSVSFASPAQK